MLKKYDGTNWNTASYGKYFSGTEQFTNFPVVIRSLDQSVQAYTIKGNTSASGTPSPQNPITIDGVGNKTANILPPPTTVASGEIDGITYNIGADGVCTFSGISTSVVSITVDLSSSFVIPISVSSGGSGAVAFNNSKAVNALVRFFNDNTFVDEWGLGTINRTSTGYGSMGGKTITKYVFQFANGVNANNLSIAIAFSNNGIPVSPFEPYGYKISIVNDSSPLTPIYVSQPLMKIATTSDNVNSSDTATYNIRKLVMDRNISITDSGTSGNYHRYSIRLDGCSNRGSEFSTDVITTHYRIQTGWGNGNAYLYSEFLFISLLDSEYPNSSALKSFFTAQYDAGTPITVWYILATPTTESVTVPTILTTGGTATIDVDTTVKPSEMSLTYNGKHLNKSKKYNGNNWT